MRFLFHAFLGKRFMCLLFGSASERQSPPPPPPPSSTCQAHFKSSHFPRKSYSGNKEENSLGFLLLTPFCIAKESFPRTNTALFCFCRISATTDAFPRPRSIGKCVKKRRKGRGKEKWDRVSFWKSALFSLLLPMREGRKRREKTSRKCNLHHYKGNHSQDN